ACRRFLKAHRVIDAGEVNRVLDAAHHHRLLVVRPAGRAPLRQTLTFLIAAGVVRMKDDFGAAHRRPSHSLRIAPALVTNRDSKLEAVDFEKLPRISGHIELIFGWVELVLRLISLNLTAGINDDGDNLPALVGQL